MNGYRNTNVGNNGGSSRGVPSRQQSNPELNEALAWIESMGGMEVFKQRMCKRCDAEPDVASLSQTHGVEQQDIEQLKADYKVRRIEALRSVADDFPGPWLVDYQTARRWERALRDAGYFTFLMGAQTESPPRNNSHGNTQQHGWGQQAGPSHPAAPAQRHPEPFMSIIQPSPPGLGYREPQQDVQTDHDNEHVWMTRQQSRQAAQAHPAQSLHTEMTYVEEPRTAFVPVRSPLNEEAMNGLQMTLVFLERLSDEATSTRQRAVFVRHITCLRNIIRFLGGDAAPEVLAYSRPIGTQRDGSIRRYPF